MHRYIFIHTYTHIQIYTSFFFSFFFNYKWKFEKYSFLDFFQLKIFSIKIFPIKNKLKYLSWELNLSLTLKKQIQTSFCRNLSKEKKTKHPYVIWNYLKFSLCKHVIIMTERTLSSFPFAAIINKWSLPSICESDCVITRSTLLCSKTFKAHL